MNGATRVAAVCAAGLLIVAALGKATSGQGFPKPTLPEGPVEVRGNVMVANSPTVETRQSGPWTVRLDDQARVQIATPGFIEKDGTYEIRWSEIEFQPRPSGHFHLGRETKAAIRPSAHSELSIRDQ